MKKILIILTSVLLALKLNAQNCDTAQIKTYLGNLFLYTTTQNGIVDSVFINNTISLELSNYSGTISLIKKTYINGIEVIIKNELFTNNQKTYRLTEDEFFKIICFGFFDSDNLKLLITGAKKLYND